MSKSYVTHNEKIEEMGWFKKMIRNWLGVKDYEVLSQREIETLINMSVNSNKLSDRQLMDIICNTVTKLVGAKTPYDEFESNYGLGRLRKAREAFDNAILKAVVEYGADEIRENVKKRITEPIMAEMAEIAETERFYNSEQFLDVVIARIKNKQLN